MSGNKKKDPSAQRVAEAQEYAKAHPTEIHSHNLYGALSTTEDSMTWQDYLDEWGEKNDTGQAPNFTPNLPNPDDIKPAPSGEDQISKDLPKNSALLSIEPFENWSFTQIYDAMHSASSTPTLTGERGNLGDAWREVNRNIYNARTTYDDAISQVESQGGWTGKTHDAVWDNIQQYLPEIDNLYKAVDALAILFDSFDKTIFQTRWYLENYKQAYDKDKAAYPHFADTIEQNYSGAAQQVMAKVYVPGIQFIRDNNPAFSGPTPKLTDPSPPPPPPPPPLDLSDLKDIFGQGGGPPPPPPPPPLDLSDLKDTFGQGGGPPPPPPPPPDLSQDLKDLLGNGGGPPPPPGPDGFTPPPPPPGVGDPNSTDSDGLAPPPPPPGVGDPNSTGSDGLAPPPPPPGVGGSSGGGAGNPLSSLSGLADSAKSLASNPGASGGPGAAADAAKQALNALGKGPGGAPEGLAGLGAKGPNGMSGPTAPHAGGAGGRAGVGPSLSGHAGVPVAAASKDLALSSGPQGANTAAGAPAGGGSGAGSPSGGGGGAGQRGQGEKEHKANKALRTKVNGEWVIGEIDAVVPVIGDDQPGQHADDQVAPPSTRTAPPADRPSRHEQRHEPRIVPATEPVRRTSGT